MLHSDHYIDKLTYLNIECEYSFIFKKTKDLISYLRQELIKCQSDSFDLNSLTGQSSLKQVEKLVANLEYHKNYEIIDFSNQILKMMNEIQSSDYNEWVEIEKFLLMASKSEITNEILKDKAKQFIPLLYSLYPDLALKHEKNEKYDFIKKQRTKCEKFKHLQKEQFFGILKQIVQGILSSDDLVDLKRTKSLFQSITSSFFKSKNNVSSSSEFIILFVVGGISVQECQDVFDFSDGRFIVGSNFLTTPSLISDKF